MLAAWWTGFRAAECERALGLVADSYNLAVCAGFLGSAYLVAGNIPRAIPWLEQGLTRSAEAGVRQHESWFGACLAEAWCVRGDPARARAFAERALARAREVHFPWGTGVALRALGHATVALGDVAARELDEARAEATRLELPHMIAEIELLTRS